MRYTANLIRDRLGITAPPSTLFHYTSIETLALILQYKTLRFTRLDLVNDPSEAETTDLPNAASLVFASCWTDLSLDTLPMWRMYTPNMQGVRIELPNNPFQGRNPVYLTEDAGYWQAIDQDIEFNHGIPDSGIVTRFLRGPNKIVYTNDPKERVVTCLESGIAGEMIRLEDLGQTKSLHWQFEQEWRYRVLATFSEVHPQPLTGFNQHYVHPREIRLSMQHVDICLDNTALQEMNVLLGPCCNEAHLAIVTALMASHQYQGRIEQSQIRFRMK